MAQKLKTSEGVFDLSKMDALDKARWATLGMGEKDLKPLLQHMDAFALYDGNKLTDLQFSKWEPQLVSKYKLFLNRATNKIIQENDIGALSKWMHNPLAQMFLQFRTFTLGAWSHALLWQFNHMRLYARYPHLIMTNPSLFVGVMAETFFGIIAQLLHDASNLTTEEGRERFMANLKDPAYLLRSGFGRASLASILPTLYDTIAPIIPFAHLKPQFSNVRSSGSSMSALWGSPTVDLMNSASTIFKMTADGATSDKGFTQSQIKAIFRLLPWGNSLPLIAGINGLIEDHPHH
ncbi:hypothetical protein [Bartonella sp. DGB2]|uniref:hypothetical protein n=1 Tax=Bartonella sp. DGB2 TaxID=3388426 RepID=UPI0039902B45